MSRSVRQAKVFKASSDFDKPVQFDSTINVDGAATLDVVTINGVATLNGAVVMSDDLQVVGALDLDGAVDFAVAPTGLPSGEGDAPAAVSSNDTGVTGSTSAETVLVTKNIRLTLTAVVVDIADADDFGGEKILGLVDGQLLSILAAKVDLILTKDGVGFIAATDMTVGIGTAVASNTTLSGAMIDVLALQSLTDNVIAPPLNVGAALTNQLSLVASTDSLFLNIAGATEVAQDGDITITGTIDLTVIDHGAI